MKKYTTLGLLAVALLLGVSSAGGTVIVSDNFDSYASTAAMLTVWGGTGALGTLSTTQSYSPSQSAYHPGGVVNIYQPGIGTVTPSLTNNLVLTAKIYDDAVLANDRISVGLRTGAAPLFEMGRYNSFNTAPTGTNTYGIRGLSLGNGIVSPAWTAFSIAGAAIPATAGWHTYVATFSIADGLTVTLDLNSNGSIDSTLHFAGDGVTPFGNFTDLRFGGPSNNTSAGGGANFDDIKLEYVAVPEPASFLLMGLAGVLAGCRRSR